jgi:hypothetical protein
MDNPGHYDEYPELTRADEERERAKKTDTTTNTGAASLSDEQLDDILNEHWNYQGVPRVSHIIDAMRAAISVALSIATPQADAAPTFEAWATNEGLISESHGVRFVNSMCDVARKAWDAAIAAGGAQEAVAWKVDGLNGHNESAPGVWLKKVNADAAAAMLFKSSVTPLYAAPLPREVATVWLTDEQRTAIAGGAAALRKIGGFDSLAEELDGLRAAAANGEQ